MHWHVAQMYVRLDLTPDERRRAVQVLESYVEHTPSAIVKVMALQTLADFALQEPALAPRVVSLIQAQIADGRPAVLSRGKKLLRRLGSGK